MSKPLNVASVMVTGDRQQARRCAIEHPASLVVWIGDHATSDDLSCASIGVSVGHASLARRLTEAVTSALGGAVAALPEMPSVVRVSSRRAIVALGCSLEGVVAIVPVTLRNVRCLARLVDALQQNRVAGIQLVWDGNTPERSLVEPWVFAVLESARTRPGRAPLVLARSEVVVAALRVLIDSRNHRGSP